MNKWDLLLATVCDLNPDIVGITESWTTNNVLDSELHLSGYQLLRCDRNTENRGGGTIRYDTTRDAILTCARKPT